jgi:hypothetical protein
LREVFCANSAFLPQRPLHEPFFLAVAHTNTARASHPPNTSALDYAGRDPQPPAGKMQRRESSSAVRTSTANEPYGAELLGERNTKATITFAFHFFSFSVAGLTVQFFTAAIAASVKDGTERIGVTSFTKLNLFITRESTTVPVATLFAG